MLAFLIWCAVCAALASIFCMAASDEDDRRGYEDPETFHDGSGR